MIHHHALQILQGAGNSFTWLQNPDADRRFYYAGVAPQIAIAAFWANPFPLAGFPQIFRVGGPNNAAGVNIGVEYRPDLKRFEAFMSNGSTFTIVPTSSGPYVTNAWYFLGVSYTPTAIHIDAYSLAGLIESTSGTITGPYNQPAVTAPLTIGSIADNTNVFVGQMDSFMFGFTGDGSLCPSAQLWNNGKALDWEEAGAIVAAITTGGGKINLWADFNEQSGSVFYDDASGFQSFLYPIKIATGGVLTRVTGAGF